MRYSKRLAIALLPVVLTAAISAQSSKTFKARLAPVPIDISMQSTIAGSGSATAVLAGSKLQFTGPFHGPKSPATIAQVHKSPVRGVRGPAVFDLTVAR